MKLEIYDVIVWFSILSLAMVIITFHNMRHIDSDYSDYSADSDDSEGDQENIQ